MTLVIDNIYELNKSIRSARNLGYYRKRSNKFSYITVTRGMHRHLEMSMLRAHGLPRRCSYFNWVYSGVS
jgi:hypothetical protein